MIENQYLRFYKGRTEFLEVELEETINENESLRTEIKDLRQKVLALNAHVYKMQDLNEVLLNKLKLMNENINVLKKMFNVD